MGAIWILASAEIRQRWRSAVVLTLLVGVVGAVVVATAAGAQRTDTALARFNAASRSADVQLFPGEATTAQLRAFARVPEVATVATLRAFALTVPSAPNVTSTAAAVDSKFGSVVDRGRVVQRGPHADLVVDPESVYGRLHASWLAQTR